jgi:hypothetical protein
VSLPVVISLSYFFGIFHGMSSPAEVVTTPALKSDQVHLVMDAKERSVPFVFDPSSQPEDAWLMKTKNIKLRAHCKYSPRLAPSYHGCPERLERPTRL